MDPEVTPNSPLPIKKPNFLPTFLLLLSLFLFATTAIFAYQTTKLTQQLTQLEKTLAQPTPTPTISSSPTATDETANWQTYTNNNLGFAFKFPSDYFKYQKDSNSGVYLAPSKGTGGNGPKFLEATDLWFEVNTETSIDLLPNTPYTQVTIGGVTGKKYTTSFAAVAGDVTVYQYLGTVMKNNHLFSITLSSWSADTHKKSENLFDQILSTFKFLP